MLKDRYAGEMEISWKIAGSSEIEKRVRESTDEFRGLKINQSPAFVLQSVMRDQAVCSQG